MRHLTYQRMLHETPRIFRSCSRHIEHPKLHRRGAHRRHPAGTAGQRTDFMRLCTKELRPLARLLTKELHQFRCKREKEMHPMHFEWRDYHPQTMGYIESWLDERAVQSTGLDAGFRDFYTYWANEDGFAVGENFWCKVVFEDGHPFAVVAFCQHEGTTLIMEIVVKPEKRGQGGGSRLLKELLESEEITGFAIRKSEAVIFTGNIASQKAFENAGFRYHHTHEDGDAMIYVYESDLHK